MKESEDWSLVIQPQYKWYDLRLKEVLRYKDLLLLLVKRDFVSIYKQTILGPLWIFIQPMLTTITFTIIFSGVAKISTNGMPPVLFYLTGITLWTYFADCLNKTSLTFTTNAKVFGKVYFPRLIVPLSVLVSNLIKLGIQLFLFFLVWLYYYFTTDSISPNSTILLLPVYILLMAGLGLGFGTIISALTTKYRDMTFLVAFGVQLMMYASPIVYPLSIVSGKLKLLLLLNPVTSIIEAFKYSFTGTGHFSPLGLLYSFCFMLFILSLGIVMFKRVEKSFIDTV